MAQFQQDVDVLGIFKEMLELANVLVFDTPVDLDLAH